MLVSLRNIEWPKALITHVVKENTTVSLDGISERLKDGGAKRGESQREAGAQSEGREEGDRDESNN